MFAGFKGRESTLIGASGELMTSNVMEMLDKMNQGDINQDDGYTEAPRKF
jgi:hypothetical protein